MSLSASSRLQFTPDLSICRILNGMWQVSGAHGKINPAIAVQEMFQYLDAGFTTWDLADHYGPAEALIGELRRQLQTNRGEASLAKMQAFTKWVPRPGRMTRDLVERNIDLSRRRMETSTLDLLQFHWWDYQDANYLEALKHLADLQQAGKIRHLALTNFDTKHLQIILEQGIPIVSNQVQYSLVDRRPTVQMAAFCQQHGIQLLTYGTLCGGLLSEKYLGAQQPGAGELTTASLRKYQQMINAWGDWGQFQQLLQTLQAIARKHQVSLANVAVRAILDAPAVGGVIVGSRLSIAQHLTDNARVFSFSLDAEDLTQLEGVLPSAQALYGRLGDCGDEYRR